MRRIAHIVSDIRQRQYLDAYSGWILALLVTGLQIFSGFTSEHSWSTVIVSATTVLLLGIIALATAEIRRKLSSGDSVVPSKSRLFSNRNQLPPLREVLENSHRMVEIYGLQLGHVVHHLLPVIAEQAALDCRFRLALLSPVYANGDRVSWVGEMGSVHGFPNLEDLLRANLIQLRHWYSGLTSKQRRNIEIRAYAIIPTTSVILVDADRRNGYAHVEPILHLLSPMERPTVWVARADNTQLFELIATRYKALWESATKLQDLQL